MKNSTRKPSSNLSSLRVCTQPRYKITHYSFPLPPFPFLGVLGSDNNYCTRWLPQYGCTMLIIITHCQLEHWYAHNSTTVLYCTVMYSVHCVQHIHYWFPASSELRTYIRPHTRTTSSVRAVALLVTQTLMALKHALTRPGYWTHGSREWPKIK